MKRNDYIDIFKAIGHHDYVIYRSDYLEMIRKNPLVNGLWTTGKWFCFVVNTQSWELEFVTGNSQEVIGFSHDDIMRSQAQFVADLIHPDDYRFSTSAIAATMKYVIELPYDQRPMVYAVFYNRAIKKDGSVIIMQNQNIPLVFDENNIPFIFSNIITDITYLQPKNIPHALVVNKFTKETRHLDPTHLQLQPYHTIFTARELDVIRLLIKGMNSRQIAATLNISHETIRTHRKNILVKSGLKNTSQLISYILIKEPHNG